MGIDDLEVDWELVRIDEPLCADEVDLGGVLAALPEPERRERDELTVTLNGDDRPVALALHDELLHESDTMPADPAAQGVRQRRAAASTVRTPAYHPTVLVTVPISIRAQVPRPSLARSLATSHARSDARSDARSVGRLST